jgi:hypothetical protein
VGPAGGELSSVTMRPAASKAPGEFLFAFAVCATVIGTSFAVKPPSTEWIVFGVGVFMFVSVLVAALKPVRT